MTPFQFPQIIPNTKYPWLHATYGMYFDGGGFIMMPTACRRNSISHLAGSHRYRRECQFQQYESNRCNRCNSMARSKQCSIVKTLVRTEGQRIVIVYIDSFSTWSETCKKQNGFPISCQLTEALGMPQPVQWLLGVPAECCIVAKEMYSFPMVARHNVIPNVEYDFTARAIGKSRP